MDLRQQLDALRTRRLAESGFPDGPVEPCAAPSRAHPHRIEELIDGQELTNAAGSCFVATERHAAAQSHGRHPLGRLSRVQPETLAFLANAPALAGIALTRLAFIDTETTGLAGGTGTYAFLVGIGQLTADGDFIVRQLFMRDYVEEPAMLAALVDVLEPFEAVVSFNGKSFDLPLLQTRLALQRRPFALARAPHLDLLSPARRIWRDVLPSCALSSLEQHILGVRRTTDDTPGWLIPSLYFDYLRGGDASPLAGVFYHNRLDILSMATLAAHLGQAYEQPMESGLAPAELIGLARLLEDAGRLAECQQLYSHALQNRLPRTQQESALCRLSYLHKRAGRRAEAAVLWQSQLHDEEDPPLYPYVELAKYGEWVTGDLNGALEITQRARQVAQRWQPGPQRHKVLSELEHRLLRLQRKLAGQIPPDAEPEE